MLGTMQVKNDSILAMFISRDLERLRLICKCYSHIFITSHAGRFCSYLQIHQYRFHLSFRAGRIPELVKAILQQLLQADVAQGVDIDARVFYDFSELAIGVIASQS